MSDNLVTINIYPEMILEDDLTPDFGVEIDDICTDIYEACKGWGTNNKRLIEAIGNTTPEDRHKISLRYKEIYDKKLKDLMKSETSGDYGTALQFCALSPAMAECAMLKKACKGLGTNEKLLYSIICGRSNQDMEHLKKTYYKLYTKDLGKLVSSEISGDFSKIVFSCLQAAEEEFDPDYHTEDKAKEDAEELYKAGQGRWGTNEKKMFKIVILSPPKYLKMVNMQYADMYGYTLPKAMEKELSGEAKNAAVFTLEFKLKPYETVAKLIKSACAGIGTDELLLTCCIIRFQSIMPQVNIAHMELFGKSVHDRIRSEVKGNYKDLLLALMNKVFPEG